MASCPQFFCGCLEQMAVAIEQVLSSSTVFSSLSTCLILTPPLGRKKALLGGYSFGLICYAKKIPLFLSNIILSDSLIIPNFSSPFFIFPRGKKHEGTVDGRNPAPVDMIKISSFTFGFIHQQYK